MCALIQVISAGVPFTRQDGLGLNDAADAVHRDEDHDNASKAWHELVHSGTRFGKLRGDQRKTGMQ